MSDPKGEGAGVSDGGRNVVQSRVWPVRTRRPGERRSLSRSATRALDVLELFGQVRRPLRAVEVSRALDMHPSSTNQLLKTMVEAGHLIFDARAKAYLRYRLRPREAADRLNPSSPGVA